MLASDRIEAGRPAPEADFQIGIWTVRPQRDCIEGPDGVVRLAPKAMAVLTCLARAPGGGVVSRQEIFASVWPECEVTDDALTQRIVELRKAFGDSARDPTVIETIPKIGFRLIPPVEPAQSPRRPPASAAGRQPARTRPARPRNWLVNALALLGVLAIGYLFVVDPQVGPEQAGTGAGPVEPSVAVLHFENFGGQDDDLRLADAIHEEVLTRLARIASLKVIAHSSVERYRDSGASLDEIAGALGVTTVLTGSVQRQENHVRVRAQLLDPLSGEYLWAGGFDRELSAKNLFAIQSEIAEQVAASLSTSLSPEDIASLTATHTENFGAYREVLKGRVALETGTIEGLERALAHYERALELNPEFPQAHMAIAAAYSTALEDRGVPQSLANGKIEEHARKALSLDPKLGHAYKFLGQVRRWQGHYNEAEMLFRQALELDPGNVHILHGLGLTLRLQGRARESVPYYDRAVEVDPLSTIINESRGSLLRDLGRFEEAEQQYRLTLDLDPGLALAYWGLGTLDWSRGDPEGALRWFEHATRVAPESDAFRSWKALMHLDLGQDDQARAVLDEAFRTVPITRDNDAVLIEELYRIYHGLGIGDIPDGRRFLQPAMFGGLAQLPARELLAGDYAAAIDHYERQYPGISAADIEIDGSNYRSATYVAFALHRLGRRHQALALADQVESALAGMYRLGIHGYWVTDAQVEAIRGNQDKSLERLESAIQEGWRNLWRFYLFHDPVLQDLRGRPEFASIARRVEQQMMPLRTSGMASRTPSAR
jgi:tetratricopeptide (TPR) repeat protein/DNA-binding winged helix-turn-helix (wHTH) protein